VYPQQRNVLAKVRMFVAHRRQVYAQRGYWTA
jgi:hypothetical protein